MQEENRLLNLPLELNTINIFEPITSATAERVITLLQYYDYEFKKKHKPYDERVIIMQINSPGGSVADGLAIYDVMNYVDAKIATVGIGMCASMGAFLLSSGTKGMRSVMENCEVVIHQPLGGVQGQASDIILAANHIKEIRTRLNRILSENTGKSPKEIARDTDRDNVMMADEALHYGLVDKVIQTPMKAKGGTYHESK